VPPQPLAVREEMFQIPFACLLFFLLLQGQNSGARTWKTVRYFYRSQLFARDYGRRYRLSVLILCFFTFSFFCAHLWHIFFSFNSKSDTMAREIKNNEFNSNESRNESFNDRDRLEGLAASEMADRGPKGMSAFTGEEDGTETRPVTHMYAEPGGSSAADDDDVDDDDDFDDDDDLDIDDEDMDVDDDDDVEIDDNITDDDLDDDLTLDDDEDEDEDNL